jgi:DNA-binding IclR family transcriptional regulator
VATDEPTPQTALWPSHNAAGTTRSVRRALAMLEALGYSASPLRLSDLARATRLSKATVHRMLKALVAHDFVAKVGPGYTLGQRPLELAASGSAVEAHGLKRRLRPFLLELYELTHGVVSFAVLYHSQVHYPDILHHRSHSPAPWHYGKAVPAYRTAAGKLLLAYKPTVLDWLASLEVTHIPDAYAPGATELLCELRLIRTRGLACVDDAGVPRKIEVAAPVVGPEGQVLAALSVSGPADRLDPQTASLHAIRIARAASACLQRPSADVPVEQ